jgi:hypothetical protein
VSWSDEEKFAALAFLQRIAERLESIDERQRLSFDPDFVAERTIAAKKRINEIEEIERIRTRGKPS